MVPVLCGESPVVCLLGETGSGKSTQVGPKKPSESTNGRWPGCPS